MHVEPLTETCHCWGFCFFYPENIPILTRETPFERIAREVPSMPNETAKRIHSLAPVRPLPHFSSFARELEDRLSELRVGIRGLPERDSRGIIHDLRVLSRRARAAFEIVAPCIPGRKTKKMRRALQCLTTLLGPVRSLDVSHSDLKKRINIHKLSSPVFDYLLKKLKKQRKKARKSLLKEIKNLRLARRLKKVSSLHPKKEPNSEIFLGAVLSQTKSSGEDLLDSWRRFEKKGRLTDLHGVRIELKKWRYLLEFQEKYTGAPDQSHLKRIKSIQELLGDTHDTEVLHDWLKNAKIPKRKGDKKGLLELEGIKKELKTQLRTGLQTFHRDGEKILMNLFSERSGS